jgi:hypothetical protein
MRRLLWLLPLILCSLCWGQGVVVSPKVVKSPSVVVSPGSSGGGNTWTFVASSSGQSGRGVNLDACTAGVCHLTVTSTGTGHAAILQAMATAGSGITISSVSGGCGTWVVASGAHISNASEIDVNQAYCTSTVSGATTITATMSTTSTFILIYFEWSWSGSTITFDVANTATNASGTTTGPSLTLTGTNDLISQVSGVGSGDPTAITSPYSTEFINTDGTAAYSFTAGATAGNITSYAAPTWTLSVAGQNLVSAVALKGS